MTHLMLGGRLRAGSYAHWIFGTKCYKVSVPVPYSTCAGRLELPIQLKATEKKPWTTAINDVKRKARLEKQERRVVREATLKPPENGLLVKSLIPVAYQVVAARARLLACVSRVAESIPIFVCSTCGDAHVGNPPHKIRTCNVSGNQKNKEHTWVRGGTDHLYTEAESFHLYDRLGRAVSHEERLQVDRIPAILELCIQAGVDIPEYPTRRRAFPVYQVAGKMIDFEKRFPKDDSSGNNIKPYGFWEMSKKSNKNSECWSLPCSDVKGHAELGMQAWENIQSGIVKLMEKYAIQTCGYCLEVQVGPKGHQVRQCQAHKHQMRDGQHAWQEATFDDLVPPVYVWHVPDTDNSLLIDCLKRYYWQLPALVELFGKAGAEIGENYMGIMRGDIVVPRLDEEKLVA